MEDFIAHAASLAGLYKIVCLPRAGLPNHGQELQRGIVYSRLCWHQCCVFKQRRIRTVDTPGLP